MQLFELKVHLFGMISMLSFGLYGIHSLALQDSLETIVSYSTPEGCSSRVGIIITVLCFQVQSTYHCHTRIPHRHHTLPSCTVPNHSLAPTQLSLDQAVAARSPLPVQMWIPRMVYRCSATSNHHSHLLQHTHPSHTIAYQSPVWSPLPSLFSLDCIPAVNNMVDVVQALQTVWHLWASLKGHHLDFHIILSCQAYTSSRIYHPDTYASLTLSFAVTLAALQQHHALLCYSLLHSTVPIKDLLWAAIKLFTVPTNE